MKNINEKFCTKCGKKFIATGREVICPECRKAAAEETKRAAILRAKRASWTGESVPVRISGRASSVIRQYGAANNLPFAAALDELLKQSVCFKGMQMAWEDVVPYKSRRRDKTTSTAQDAPQEVKAAAKKAVKTAAGKAANKASKAASKEVKKAVKTAAVKKGEKA